LQLPLQHSVPLPHEAPDALQHVFPAPHVSPAQQSPGTLHAPAPAEHPHFVVALLQIAPLQQSPVTPHVAPAATQPHFFSELHFGPVEAQQSVARVQVLPSPPHPHFPVDRSQTPLQHWPSVVQPLPSAKQQAPGGPRSILHVAPPAQS
jgi:hypothetical protein